MTAVAVAVAEARVEPPPAPSEPPEAPLRARVLRAAVSTPAELDGWLEAEPGAALATWFGPEALRTMDVARLRRLLDRDVAMLDEALGRACDAVLHSPRFQALEAAWRGVAWLVRGLGVDGLSIVKLLDARWAEVTRDLERAPDFDQSHLFHLIYDEEFGMPGGVPYGLLVGLYEVAHRPVRGRSGDDVAALRALSRVCAAAFSPIVMGVGPALFGAESFGDLELRQSLAATLSDLEHRRFQSFAESSDARFVALAGPRVLLRTAYRGREAGDCGFRYEERVRAGGGDELWGNAALALAQVCLRAFDDHRWLAAIRGAVDDELSAGVVTDLPVPAFATDAREAAFKFPLEINLSSTLERDMADAGLICLKRCKDTPFLAFYNLPTLHQPPRGGLLSEIARSNAQLGAMLNYVLCVSRFAHYVKVIGRDWVGSLKNAADCENKLQNWLMRFTSAGGNRLSYEMKSRYPLEEGRVRVQDVAGRPGVYECVMHLKPHFQLDQAVSEFALTTTLAGVERSL